MQKIYEFENLEEATFIERPNRYIANIIKNNGEKITIHVHDPGRLEELLFKGNKILIKYAASKTRKTDYDMIAAKKNKEWILIHSGYHRKIAEAFFEYSKLLPFKNIKLIKPEIKFENSRLDFYIETDTEKIYVEQKGCTLSVDNIAIFPDAPTTRGVKHLNELIKLKKLGFSSVLMVFVFSKALKFKANKQTDPLFYTTLNKAIANGVKIYVFQFQLIKNAIYYEKRLEYEK